MEIEDNDEIIKSDKMGAFNEKGFPVVQFHGRTMTNMKYELILFLVEHKNLNIQEIINLTPTDALEIFKNEQDAKLLQKLKSYINGNKELIIKSNFFFPGRNGQGKASEGSILHSFHFYLKEHYPGRTLKSLGLRSKPESFYEKSKNKPNEKSKETDEPQTAEEIFNGLI